MPDSNANGLTLAVVQPGWRKWLYALSIQQKMGLSYASVFGLVIAGTTGGITLANHYQLQADALRHDAQEESQLINQLQLSLLAATSYQEHLTHRPEDTDRFAQEFELFRHNIDSFDRTWSELKSSYANPNVEEHAEEVEEFAELVIEYDGIIENYVDQAANLKTIQISNALSQTQVNQIRSEFERLDDSATFRELDNLIIEIEELALEVQEEYTLAEMAFNRASRLADRVILISVALSIAAASGVAISMSRAISRPIKAATAVAQQVYQDRNFDLQVPVTTGDEVGTLNLTLNQLITQVKQLLREQQIAQAQLVQSEKMSGLGQLVAGVAHEINNPVNFIHGNLSYLQQYVDNLVQLIQSYQKHYPDPPEDLQEQLEESELDFLVDDLQKLVGSLQTGTKRIQEIVLSLRNFSRLDEAELKEVNICDGIDSTLMILGHRLKPNHQRPGIEVIKDYQEMPLVECYPGSLNQVFMNLLANAIDALEEANRSKTFEEIQQNPNQIQVRAVLVDSQWVAIHVVDNGLGMGEQVRSQLFNPFFTTKAIGKGTGLGLSISHQIITEQHGGKLDCYSIPGQGAEFVVQIPLRQSQRAQSLPLSA